MSTNKIREYLDEAYAKGIRVFSAESIAHSEDIPEADAAAFLDTLASVGEMEKRWRVCDPDGESIWESDKEPDLPRIIQATRFDRDEDASTDPEDYGVGVYYLSKVPRVSDFDRGKAAERLRWAARAREMSNEHAKAAVRAYKDGEAIESAKHDGARDALEEMLREMEGA